MDHLSASSYTDYRTRVTNVQNSPIFTAHPVRNIRQ